MLPIESLGGRAVRDIRHLAVLQNFVISTLSVLLLLGLYPVLQLHVLLGELIEKTLIQENHVFGLLEVALKLIVLQVPPIGLSFSLSHFFFHLGAFSFEGGAAVPKG